MRDRHTMAYMADFHSIVIELLYSISEAEARDAFEFAISEHNSYLANTAEARAKDERELQQWFEGRRQEEIETAMWLTFIKALGSE